jgi:hypothetical protein
VGLISRLTAPAGGYDELVRNIEYTHAILHPLTGPPLHQSYAEFCRSLYDSSTPEFLYALEDFEKAYGKARNTPSTRARTHARTRARTHARTHAP